MTQLTFMHFQLFVIAFNYTPESGMIHLIENRLITCFYHIFNPYRLG